MKICVELTKEELFTLDMWRCLPANSLPADDTVNNIVRQIIKNSKKERRKPSILVEKV